MSIRKVFFWLHLIAGVVAGIVILIMSATGVALAFEKEIVAWMERDVRRVAPPAEAARLPVEQLLAKVRAAQPDARPSGVTIYSDPTIATLVSMGRTNSFHVNPYTGDVKPQGAAGTREFMHVMIDWHRFLSAHGDNRPMGKAITGACNVAFCFLALSGIYLWWPRQWTRNVLSAITLFNWKLSGKARDWNWHNVIGIWTTPVLVVLTVTAMPISYRWAGDAIYKITRSEPPAQAGPPGSAPAVEVPTPAPGAKPLGHDALLAVVQKEIPHWNQITLRLGGGGGPRGGGERREGSTNAPRAEVRGEGRGEGRAPQAMTFAVKQSSGAPRFATAQLTLDPFTGAILRAEKFSDYNLGRQVRSWTRFLHTGEALGRIGQFVAGVASLGGVVLVYTGFALAIRRFWRWRNPKSKLPAEMPESISQ